MAKPSARQIALGALRVWQTQRRFADSTISSLLAKAELGASNRAFALELFYGVLRNLLLLDFWIGCLRASRIDASLRDLLRLGLYQLLLLKTAEHAAVYETVEPQDGKMNYVREATRNRCSFEPRIPNF